MPPKTLTESVQTQIKTEHCAKCDEVAAAWPLSFWITAPRVTRGAVEPCVNLAHPPPCVRKACARSPEVEFSYDLSCSGAGRGTQTHLRAVHAVAAGGTVPFADSFFHTSHSQWEDVAGLRYKGPHGPSLTCDVPHHLHAR